MWDPGPPWRPRPHPRQVWEVAQRAPSRRMPTRSSQFPQSETWRSQTWHCVSLAVGCALGGGRWSCRPPGSPAGTGPCPPRQPSSASNPPPPCDLRGSWAPPRSCHHGSTCPFAQTPLFFLARSRRHEAVIVFGNSCALHLRWAPCETLRCWGGGGGRRGRPPVPGPARGPRPAQPCPSLAPPGRHTPGAGPGPRPCWPCLPVPWPRVPRPRSLTWRGSGMRGGTCAPPSPTTAKPPWRS